jgi:hypothetical protein
MDLLLQLAQSLAAVLQGVQALQKGGLTPHKNDMQTERLIGIVCFALS